MSIPLLLLVGLIYVVVGVDLRRESVGMLVVYASYATANVGFVMDILHRRGVLSF